jgi:heat-inducible transcriptional repressor
MLLHDLTERSRMILRLAVDAYLASGEPVGSRSLAEMMEKHHGTDLSSATIRNTMADLEEAGLLYAPHISAGRLPTIKGVKFFVDGLLQIGQIEHKDRKNIEQHLNHHSESLQHTLERAGHVLSSLSQCAGLVAAPKHNPGLQQIEFVSLNVQKILVVLVKHDGTIENRLVTIKHPIPASILQRAANYLNAQFAGALQGQPIHQAAQTIRQDIQERKQEIDTLTAQLIETGLAESIDSLHHAPDDFGGTFIVRGQAHLLNNVRALDDVERLRRLFATLEERQTLLQLVEQTHHADGVQIFIGAENAWFDHAGCSLIVAPYKNKENQVVGALGVIGPTRMAYGRIIPMVDFTAKSLTRMLQTG